MYHSKTHRSNVTTVPGVNFRFYNGWTYGSLARDVCDICLEAVAIAAQDGGLVVAEENDSCFVRASPRLDSLPALFLELKWSRVRLILFLSPESKLEQSSGSSWLDMGCEARRSGLFLWNPSPWACETVLGMRGLSAWASWLCGTALRLAPNVDATRTVKLAFCFANPRWSEFGSVILFVYGNAINWHGFRRSCTLWQVFFGLLRLISFPTSSPLFSFLSLEAKPTPVTAQVQSSRNNPVGGYACMYMYNLHWDQCHLERRAQLNGGGGACTLQWQASIHAWTRSSNQQRPVHCPALR